MTAVVDVATLDSATRALADRGARAAFNWSLDTLLDNLKVAGQEFEEEDLNTLVEAGRMAEAAEATRTSRNPE